jgi:hypothetical protein
MVNSVLAQDNFEYYKSKLDLSLSKTGLYLQNKDRSISHLKKQVREASTSSERYVWYKKLYDEYKSFQSDSAFVYAKQSLQSARSLTKSDIHNAQIDLAAILTTLGNYDQALETLASIEAELQPDIKGVFYWTKQNVYNGLANYANDIDLKKKYVAASNANRDQAIAFLAPNSSLYYIALSGKLIAQKEYKQAYDILYPVFKKTPTSDPDRAVIAYILSETFRLRKSRDEEKKWLAISAISDLELVKKENISLRKLAILLHEEGEIETAYEYTKRSLDDAVFCNSKLRTYEISKMLPIINESYEAKNKSNQSQLIVFLISVSVLSLFLIGVLILLFKQMKKLARAQKNVELANNQLSKLNQQLQGFNSKLNQTNLELAETSLLKEIYIGRYMDQCSIYIRKMEEYSQKLKVMATAGKVNDLVSTVKSKAFIDKELKEFYQQFDQTFTELYPMFVYEFKALINDPDSIIVKKGELLSPELRIFALIRLGIKDSAKIADFLRYSPSTIYNYRSQIKNKAKGIREEFEMKVMRIGTKSE